YIDKTWNPILETPPFPEYTSGHSVISSSSAILLTYFLGENFEFVDNTEVFFGLPERKFKSFKHAAQEAALSRLYGGIHFRDAIEEGERQGAAIGQFIVSKVRGMAD
ncbi:MAG TPA: phosphatase PAP2 family protein, partial [Cyclobacteriaceae bacterium]|nr:phosphatase PAP2 family protein [Cyclobacteriaceae bacterium]